jgi:hypothetical protein
MKNLLSFLFNLQVANLTSLKTFFTAFFNVKGVTFINLSNYISQSTGEISDYVININLSVKNAKETDLKRLQSCTDADLKAISEKCKVNIEVCKVALSEMVNSAIKNLSEKLEDRTAQSIAQTDAYINVTPALRIHKETGALHIFGQSVRKTVKVKGEYKTVNSSAKTIAKNTIKKELDLRSDKFRTFIVENLEQFKIDGQTLILG